MNELVTYGQNYSFVPGIRVLFKSAAKFCDKITLINFNLPTDVIEFCKANEVNIIDANELALKYNVDVNLSPYTLKVIFFYLYIKHISKSTNMFMCDLTDVYIQKNVFDINKENFLKIVRFDLYSRIYDDIKGNTLVEKQVKKKLN